jgi:hypothetical protein
VFDVTMLVFVVEDGMAGVVAVMFTMPLSLPGTVAGAV